MDQDLLSLGRLSGLTSLAAHFHPGADHHIQLNLHNPKLQELQLWANSLTGYSYSVQVRAFVLHVWGLQFPALLRIIMPWTGPLHPARPGCRTCKCGGACRLCIR